VLAGRFLGRGLRYRRRIECTHSVHSARFGLAGRAINCGIDASDHGVRIAAAMAPESDLDGADVFR